jgi:hypothetical protein
MADYELIGLNEAAPDLRAPTSADNGVLVGGLIVRGRSFDGLLAPLAMAVQAQMTASTTVGGVQQLDNDNLDMGTSDFTVGWDAFIPTTRPAAAIDLDRKHDGTNGYILTLRTTGVIRLQINATSYDSTVALASATNVNPKIRVVVVRESASVAGSVTFYSQGLIVGTAVAISAGAPTTVNNASARIISGTATTRTACNLQSSRLYNRALSAAEILSLELYGPTLADRSAKQSSAVSGNALNGQSTRAFTSFTGSSAGFVGTKTATNTAAYGGWDISIVVGQKIRVRFDYIASVATGSVNCVTAIRSSRSDITAASTAAVTFATGAGGSGSATAELTASLTGTYFLAFQIQSADGTGTMSLEIANAEIVKTGLVSELIASNAQSNTGQIIDTSGNRNHALLPASGATVVGANPARSRQVRSRHTWTATSELQYLGGVNQEVLPPNAAIEFIDIESNGSLSVNIGNGTTATQYASAVALVSGWNRIALASVFAGATSATRKLTITPTASATAILNCIVTYHGTEVEI